MKKLYAHYLDQIEKAIGLDTLTKSFSRELYSEKKMDMVKGLIQENKALEPKTGLHQLAELLGIPEVKKPCKGDHPDFLHLRGNGGVDYHYITSMFIDVKGSTNFHRKYDLEQIGLIIQSIIVAATHTIALFGGHIQRLQGDGVFCYFGGRNVKKDDSIVAALNAASFFSYFIKYELPDVFQLEGIDRVHTRVGIDFGDDKEVQWAIFGTEGCDELTTNSLHTSLAPKMQSNARSNGIMIGDNVYSRLGKLQLFADLLRNDKGNVDEDLRHIYTDKDKAFYYTQRLFEWPSYMQETFWFVKKDLQGRLYIDYDARPIKNGNGQRSLQNLYEKTTALAAGTASLNRGGQIQTHPNGTPITQNKFYHGPQLEK